MQTDQDEEDPEPGSDTKVDATDKKVATDLALLDLPSDEPDGEEYFTKEKEFFSSSSEALYTPSSRTSTPYRGEKKKEKESKKVKNFKKDLMLSSLQAAAALSSDSVSSHFCHSVL